MALVSAEALEGFHLFSRDDFEGDWEKVSDRSFGRVYRVKHTLRQEWCALKCLSTAGHYSDLKEEVSRLGKVRCKFIACVYGLCSDPPGLVLEYISKGSLDRLLPTHTLTWPKKLQMIHEVAMGMNFLHSMTPPLLHLNLKPANILLDDLLHVKISDFGLIKWAENAGMSVMEDLVARGNMSYLPPEALSLTPDPPGTKNDIYSFAVVMWEIMTQTKPYAGANLTEVIMRVSSGKRPSVTRVLDEQPHQCQDVIPLMEHCWQQDPRHRPAFSDIIWKTGALSDVMRLPDFGPREPHYSQLCSPKEPLLVPDNSVPDRDESTAALEFLLKKRFKDFRMSVREEDVSLRFREDNSLLHYTVASGDRESVGRVLSLGAQVNAQSRRGYTPLTVAVLRGLTDVTALLVQQGADPTLGDEDGWTALHFAAQRGDERTARLLLEHGACADAGERDGWTPMHLAAQNGHEGVARVLLARLANADLPERQCGRTPLHLASAYGHLAIARLMLGTGAVVHRCRCSVPDDAGDRPLHLAVGEGHVRMVRLLVERGGASVSEANERGHTPLHLAALRGHTLLCRYLLSHGANDANDANGRSAQGWTALHLASRRGHACTVEELGGRGVEVDARGPEGWTALHLACLHGHHEVVTKLLAAGADPNLAADSGWTPLHLAARSGSFLSVTQLLQQKADANACTNAQATPLHVAAQSGSATVVKALLLGHAHHRALDAHGRTPLHIALDNTHQDAAKILEEAEQE